MNATIPSPGACDAAASQRTLAILLVDDHDEFLAATAAFLKPHPRLRVVAQARDGLEAARLARELAPDLVLMDLSMPRVNGLDATRAIKARNTATKVVVLSMQSDRAFRDAAAVAGADAFLYKGDIPAELMPLLNRLFPKS